MVAVQGLEAYRLDVRRQAIIVFSDGEPLTAEDVIFTFERAIDERKRLYTEIALILNEELPWIFLYSPNSVYGVSNRFQGFLPPSYIDNKFWNAEEWSVSE